MGKISIEVILKVIDVAANVLSAIKSKEVVPGPDCDSGTKTLLIFLEAISYQVISPAISLHQLMKPAMRLSLHVHPVHLHKQT